MTTIELDSRNTALVLIDLQNGIIARPGTPYSTEQVVAQCAALSAQFHQHQALVVYVRVDLANFLQLNVDSPSRDPNSPPPPASASELVAHAGFQDGDLLITKRHWSAFLGTDLERQLRQHGIDTIVIGGVSTNAGVESTARDAAGLGFHVVFVEDGMTSLGQGHHQFAVENTFPRIGRVRNSRDILLTP